MKFSNLELAAVMNALIDFVSIHGIERPESATALVEVTREVDRRVQLFREVDRRVQLFETTGERL